MNLIPAYQATIIDIAVTIIHQSPAYWQGDLSHANEGNPIGGTLMRAHVSGIFVLSGLWLVIIGLAGYYLPRQFSKTFLLFTVITHSYGACTWISDRYGFFAAMALILFNTISYLLINEPGNQPTVS